MSFRFRDLMADVPTPMLACPSPSVTGLCPSPSKMPMLACPSPSMTGLCPSPSKMFAPEADAAMPLALLKDQLRQQIHA